MTPEEIRAGIGEELVVAVSDAYGLATVDVAPEHWVAALTAARDALGCAFFDWLTGVDELADGFAVVAHVCAIPRGPRLLLRTRVSRESAVLATATGVYAGAGWHERETHEMFGIDFAGHPGLAPLLLPDGFEGHPLRKEFILASRVAKPWPGAKEPGESDHGPGAARAPGRRRTLPPGVPDPATWGPHKEEAAAAAAAAPEERPRRGRGAAAAAGSAGEAGAPRRSRSVAEGSASQAGEAAAPPPARRTRSASAGSASQAGPAKPASPAEPRPPEPEPSTHPAPPVEPEPSAPGRSSAPGTPVEPVPPATPAEPSPVTEPAAPTAPAPSAKTAPSAEPAVPADGDLDDSPTHRRPATPAKPDADEAEGDAP